MFVGNMMRYRVSNTYMEDPDYIVGTTYAIVAANDAQYNTQYA